jgi:hypothetical protein
LRTDRVCHVDDGRDEESEENLLLELVLEGGDDAGRDHRSRQADRQPGQPVPQSARHGLLRRARARQKATQAGQVLFVLLFECGDELLGRDGAEQASGVVNNGDRPCALVSRLQRHGFEIDIGIDNDRLGLGFDEARQRGVGACR